MAPQQTPAEEQGQRGAGQGQATEMEVLCAAGRVQDSLRAPHGSCANDQHKGEYQVCAPPPCPATPRTLRLAKTPTPEGVGRTSALGSNEWLHMSTRGSMAAGRDGPRVRKARELTAAIAQPVDRGDSEWGRGERGGSVTTRSQAGRCLTCRPRHTLREAESASLQRQADCSFRGRGAGEWCSPSALMSTRVPLKGSAGVPGSLARTVVENSCSQRPRFLTCWTTGG